MPALLDDLQGLLADDEDTVVVQDVWGNFVHDCFIKCEEWETSKPGCGG